MRSRFPDLHVVENRRPFRTRNIVIVDPDTAEVILTAYYDTCAHLHFPNFITPGNLFVFMMYQIVIEVLPPAVLSGGVGFLLDLILNLILEDSLLKLLISEIVNIYHMLWIVILGPANKHTANDNTTEVTTFINLTESMSEEEIKEFCFVFFNLNEAGIVVLWNSTESIG